MIQNLESVDARAEHGFHSNRYNPRGARHHIFPLNVLDWHADKVIRARLGHQLATVPFLKFLNGGEADFFPVASLKQEVDSKLSRRSRHIVE